ncbi:hypothetical protein [Massilicoli timonensis]|uniref:hypothetical protein n=1 Tax=Massilicoli timonensis TaxID=2015901 RepID=UPI000C856C3E|nr:hypothetical protein [Massilicoli timonensis]
MDQDALELLKIRLATLSAIKGMKVDEVLKKAVVAALDDTLTLVEIARIAQVLEVEAASLFEK